MTAFVLTALSEVQIRSTEFAPKLAQAKTKAISFIEGNLDAISDPYSLALCSYALFRAGSGNVDSFITKLDAVSKNEGKSIDASAIMNTNG